MIIISQQYRQMIVWGLVMKESEPHSTLKCEWVNTVYAMAHFVPFAPSLQFAPSSHSPLLSVLPLISFSSSYYFSYSHFYLLHKSWYEMPSNTKYQQQQNTPDTSFKETWSNLIKSQLYSKSSSLKAFGYICIQAMKLGRSISTFICNPTMTSQNVDTTGSVSGWCSSWK